MGISLLSQPMEHFFQTLGQKAEHNSPTAMLIIPYTKILLFQSREMKNAIMPPKNRPVKLIKEEAAPASSLPCSKSIFTLGGLSICVAIRAGNTLAAKKKGLRLPSNTIKHPPRKTIIKPYLRILKLLICRLRTRNKTGPMAMKTAFAEKNRLYFCSLSPKPIM